MKTRFVKLLGLLTVLMVPAMLWVAWPYWHPMWWQEPEPPISVSRIRCHILDKSRSGTTIHNTEILGYNQQSSSETSWGYGFDSVYAAYVSIRYPDLQLTRSRDTLLLVYERSGRLSSNRFPYANKPTEAQIMSWMSGRNLDGGWNIFPHAWKRVTGEVLTPSRLKELESGGANR